MYEDAQRNFAHANCGKRSNSRESYSLAGSGSLTVALFGSDSLVG